MSPQEERVSDCSRRHSWLVQTDLTLSHAKQKNYKKVLKRKDRYFDISSFEIPIYIYIDIYIALKNFSDAFFAAFLSS